MHNPWFYRISIHIAQIIGIGFLFDLFVCQEYCHIFPKAGNDEWKRKFGSFMTYLYGIILLHVFIKHLNLLYVPKGIGAHECSLLMLNFTDQLFFYKMVIKEMKK